MPTSTPWRISVSCDENRQSSLPRPSDGDVERLSPEPSLLSHGLDYNSLTSTEQHTSYDQLVGLGLSSASYSNNISLNGQPSQSYPDQGSGAHFSAKAHSTSRQTYNPEANAKERKNDGSRSKSNNTKPLQARGHTRSGSTIDDLASVAIATSPTFTNISPVFPFNGSPSNYNASRPATSYVDGYRNDDHLQERPAKRVRSEKLHSMEWSPRDGRPRTSYAIQAQSSMEEAELLLGLRNGYSFGMAASPVFDTVSTVQRNPLENLIRPPAVEDVPIQSQKEQEHSKKGSEELKESLEIKVEHNLPERETTDSRVDRMDVDSAAGEAEARNPMVAADNTDVPEEAESAPEPPVVSTGTTSAAAAPPPAETAQDASTSPIVKKPRKIKPEIQAEVCASCNKLQRDDKDEDATTHWIGCEYCKKWFHSACQGFKDKLEARSVDKFVCKECEPQHGQTTFVRKSSRVRTAIDYAGLNQGVVKSSEESSMHHYIQPIKDGRIKVLPDDFARIRPELLTAEFWENMDNMKRPFVVPACWNPRFGVVSSEEENNGDTFNTSPVWNSSSVLYDSNGDVVESRPEPVPSDGELDTGEREVVVECDQDYLDMVMPRNLTVRKVSDLYGPEQPVPVIDVKSQETKGQWTLNDWANYYEQQGEKAIRNVISLEVSNSPIGKLIRRPKAVRDIDLEDNVWDNETRTTGNKRPVQFYCLMSVADSYTDFHIDFGGSSVYYHILKGVKTFFFIPPEDKYLREYEKWCNSDTQNDTWLGDLCNGNVTRVDLHEGDTAFIPAGWIHSVWTPEDSLVIGGNFLTRLDYELQLKVANIEKTTRVPQKFRYPFFQKVMWYALLKYLEEDPVPEEVLRDFHADEDYQYLRANPIWLEHGELVNEAEPGEPGYNTRVYPKSELRGLPSLRDYLYRTACIHADLPVPDINKKQIDAVKASIPKGHGDPMRLIKTFAVWCAWKIGNESVPKWVHDQGDGLVGEIKEREKAKEETFRVPPERFSIRNASRVKAASPVVEILSTPAKIVPTTEMNEGSSSKSRSGSRGGSLRVACDACRKRRIKCRHKDGDETIANASPPEIRPRTYSNVSVDIPKLASASPVNSTFEPSSSVSGVVADVNTTSDLAQAALATLNSHSSDSGQGTATTPTSGSAKKGRSKACEECRKSKRRCVHDEYGRIDPAKAAEPSKPRGSSGSKRHFWPGDESPAKRYKTEVDIEAQFTDMGNASDIDMMIDPALMGEGFSLDVIHPPTETFVTKEEFHVGAAEASIPPLPTLAAGASLPDGTSDPVDLPRAVEEKEIQSTRQVDSLTSRGAEATTDTTNTHHSPDADIGYSPITVDGTIAESTEKPDIQMDEAANHAPGSRHSSRQPKQIDRYVPQEHRSPSKAVSRTAGDHRASSSSERTLETNGKSRRSSSNTSGTTHQAVVHTSTKARRSQDVSERPVSRGSTAGSDVDADERFARELQASENGLRRRASMRA